MQNNYFIPFDMSKNINYNYLISLYDVAEYNTLTKRYDTINYTSIKGLAETLNISTKTLNNILSNAEYDKYISVNKQKRIITINNGFNNDTEKKKNPFVILTSAEIQILKKYADNLFYKYFIYMKYFCGYSKNKQQDFTALQFLEYCGYSTNSNNYISKLSQYNSLLLENKIISIKKYRDELGHIRNIYSINY